MINSRDPIFFKNRHLFFGLRLIALIQYFEGKKNSTCPDPSLLPRASSCTLRVGVAAIIRKELAVCLVGGWSELGWVGPISMAVWMQLRWVGLVR